MFLSWPKLLVFYFTLLFVWGFLSRPAVRMGHLVRSASHRSCQLIHVAVQGNIRVTASQDSAEQPKVWVLHQEPSFLVINKPTGLLSQSTYGVDGALFRVRRWLAAQQPGPSDPFAELPHRLDRGTSGVLLIARTRAALSILGQQFQTRKVRKEYRVAVSGQPATPRGVWIDWMRKIPEVARAELVSASMPGAQQAILEYEQVDGDTNTSQHLVELKTGRMHQIRLQFASRSHPVLGDRLYGSHREWSPLPSHAHDEHFALHASRLTFRHPQDGREIRIQAPLPEAWQRCLPSPFDGEL
jgi:23S rRNA pseudouridine1911/1915/1917 synthase